MTARYDDLQGLSVEVRDRVALVRMLYRGEDQVTRRHQHRELGEIWRRIDADPDVGASVVTGPGDGEFYVSGRPPGVARTTDTDELWSRLSRLEVEGSALVYGMIDCAKPIVSAINGAAAGAGLSVALFADISIIDERALIIDPHVMIGISAGDGALALWPLLTGMAKAKLYLLTSEALDGREAERIGLVSKCVPADQVLDTALDYARLLARGPAAAIRFNKRALNQWLRLTGIVSHDYSFALEMLSEVTGERSGSPYTSFPESLG